MTLLPRKSIVSSRRHGQVKFIKLLILVAYILLFLILFLPQADDPACVLATLGPTALALWFGPIDILGATKERKWYDPAMLINLSIFYYALKGVTLAWGVNPGYLVMLSNNMIATRYLTVTFYVMAGLIAFNWAYRTALRRKVQDGPIPLVAGNPMVGVALLSLSGILCFFLLFRSTGGNLFIFLLNPLARSYLATDVRGVTSSLGNFFLLVVDMFPLATLIWLAAIGQKKERPGISWWVHASISIGIYLLVGGRSDVIGLALSILLVYHLSVRTVKPRLIAVLGSAGVIYSYLVNLWRATMGGMSFASLAAGRSELAYRFSLDGLYAFLGSTDLSDIRVFVMIADAYGRLRPFQYGETFLRVFTQFVPRAIWPGKPLDLSIEIADLYHSGSQAGIPPGFFAETYINFHVFGVIVGGALLGFGLALIYRKWIINRSHIGTIYYAVLMPRILLLPSATFANVFNTVIVCLLGAMLAFKVSSMFADRSDVHRGARLKRRLMIQQR